MSGFYSGAYNAFFRSNATMLCTVFVAAFGIQMGFDYTTNTIWDTINKGRQWKDIKGKIMEASGGGEDDGE